MNIPVAKENSALYRWVLGLAITLFIATLLVVRLVHLQIVQADEWSEAAQANRTYTVWQPEHRGIFLDRYGKPLARNIQQYSELNQDNTSAKRISHSEALPLLATESASVQAVLGREYQANESLAHALGYTGAVTKEELLGNRSLKPTDRIGKTGLEMVYDSQLRGQRGSVLYEVDALGNRVRPLETQPGVPGAVFATEFDTYIADVAYQALGSQRGAVVVLDAKTGGVLALTNNPSFDPSLLSQTGDDEAQEQLRKAKVNQYFSDPNKIFFNRAVMGEYPPGSVFKIVTALAALESGAVTAETTVEDTGVLKVGEEYSYANWYYTQYGRVEGSIAVSRALARSNDIYFYKAAEWTGPTKLMEYAASFGLGKAPETEFFNESAGLLPTPEWKERVVGERWFLGNTYHVGIGQGDLRVTPLQVASMMQSIFHQGVRCPTHILSSSAQEHACFDLGFKEENVKVVLDGLVAACSPGGTAFPFFEFNKQFGENPSSADISRGAVACKTGTAEFGGADGRGYRKTHGWFVAGFTIPESVFETPSNPTETASSSATPVASASAQLDEQSSSERSAWLAKAKADFPRDIVIAVVVESDETQPYKEGSRDAAPVAKAVFDWIYGEE